MSIILNIIIIPLALVLDKLWGELPNKYHPIVFLGNLAVKAESFCRHYLWVHAQKKLASENFGKEQDMSEQDIYERDLKIQEIIQRKNYLRFAGIMAAIITALPFLIIPLFVFFLIDLWTMGVFNQLLSTIIAIFCVYLCIAPRCLMEHAQNVLIPLENDDLNSARTALSAIVGRNTAQMDKHGVARACIESISENLTDSVLSSLFWFSIGLYFNLELGIILMITHRIFNTLDAMWGKRNERYQFFGTFSARFDDVLNFLPARLSLITIALASYFTAHTNPNDALKVGYKYRYAHGSPNSAWSEAAFAGAIGLKLGGPVYYGNLFADYPYFGEGKLEVSCKDIRTAIELMYNSVLVFTVFCSAILFLFGII